MATYDLAPLDFAVAARSLPGAAKSGDLSLVRANARGVLVAVIDGLGHGSDAARAAEAAWRLLHASADEPLSRLVESCHAALRDTRGAVMTLAAFDTSAQAMSWIAIGNVEGLVLRTRSDGAREKFYVLPRGGIVGHRLPQLRDAMLPLAPGDLVIFATDGIDAGFDRVVDPVAPPQRIADAILERFGKPSDDALVLVGRWSGGRPS